jgi:hypothetical protein
MAQLVKDDQDREHHEERDDLPESDQVDDG